MSNTSETFLQKVGDFFSNFFSSFTKDATDISHDIAIYGNEVANWLKNGKYTALIEGGVQTIATAINPALGSLVSGLELALPKAVNAVTGVASETTAQQESTLATYLEGLKGISGTAYASAIGGFNAIVQEYATNNTGTVVSDPAHLITAAQVIHAGMTV